MAVTKRKDGRWQVTYRDYSQKLISKYSPKGVKGKQEAYAYDAKVKATKADI